MNAPFAIWPLAVALQAPQPETVGYIEAAAHRLYCVRHHAAGRRWGAALLAGSIGAERERGWRTLVLLARRLAAIGIETLRFDFRGIGESDGAFEDMAFSAWRDDVELCVNHLATVAPDVPLVLCGTRGGCLAVAECFREGLGDAMLLLSPPAGGRELLMDVLRRSLMADLLAHPDAPRQTREEIAAELDGGNTVNVDGYFWSPRLWRDSMHHVLAVPAANDRRPWKVFDFKGAPRTKLPAEPADRIAVLNAERFWEHSPQLIPASTGLFDAITGCIEQWVLKRA